MIVCFDQRTQTGCLARYANGTDQCASCGRSLRFAPVLHDQGEQVSSYCIAGLIGHGGFGAVYRAEPINGGRPVALKQTFDPDAIPGFVAEFTILCQLHHDNLPVYHTVFRAGDHGYLVMELVEGMSLHEVLVASDGPLHETQVLGYAVQICAVLSYLHNQTPPLIHRDIKPANLRLTPTGLIKLVDFGLVKQGGAQTRPSLRGLGTLAYAPFEQFGTGGTDQRSDLYSLAATLYHLLTGREPVAVPDRINASPDPLLDPRRLRPELSPGIATALIRALALLPQDRFADVAAFQRALLTPEHTPGIIASASSPTELTPPKRPSKLPWPTPTPQRRAGGLPWPGSKEEEQA